MNILDDPRDGVVERLRVTPASRLALLLGMMLLLSGVLLPMTLAPDYLQTLHDPTHSPVPSTLFAPW